MEKYVQDIRLQQWCELIEAANSSGLIPLAASTEKVNFVEVPLARPVSGVGVTPVAVVRLGSMSVEISPNVSAEFMESLGRMIHNAL